MRIFKLMVMLTAVVAVCLIGCGGDDNPTDNNNGDNNNSGNNNNKGGGGPLSCGNRECKSAMMPDGKTWMTENLNKTTADSWCFENKPDSCKKYGGLYTWEAARSACPSGWHLPTREEWDALVTATGGTSKTLKSENGWYKSEYTDGNGTDDYGFSALPGGYRDFNGKFDAAGYNGYWWTATESSDGGAYDRVMNYFLDNVYEYNIGTNGGKSNAFSARCVQDD